MNSVLTARQLNRATLARQLLLEREPMDPLLAIERLGGLRSQTPQTWYLGLWGRLHPFDPEEVGDLLTGRQAVRISSLRGEVHTLSAADALWLRPLLGPVITRTVEGIADSAARIDQRLLARAARAVRATESDAYDPFPGFTSTLALRHVLVHGEPVVRDGDLVDAAARRGQLYPQHA